MPCGGLLLILALEIPMMIYLGRWEGSHARPRQRNSEPSIPTRHRAIGSAGVLRDGYENLSAFLATQRPSTGDMSTRVTPTRRPSDDQVVQC